MRAKDWDHFFYLHRADRPRLRKSEIAEKIGVSPSEFSKLLDPRRYDPAISDVVAEAIAQLWGATLDDVRAIYPRHRAA